MQIITIEHCDCERRRAVHPPTARTGVPFAVPAVIAVLLCRDGVLTVDQAREALEALRPHVSADQYAAAQLMLVGGVVG